MTWSTPDLATLRKRGRDQMISVTQLGSIVPNSPLRIMTDGNSGMAHLTLQYLDWLSKQLLPDSAEGEWLIRHALIWLKDGQKQASYASGTATFTGTAGMVILAGTELSNGAIAFQTTADITLGAGATAGNIAAQTAGADGNLDAGTSLSITTALSGVDGNATVVSLTGGTDAESESSLRNRVIDRIQKPPQGGDADDYVAWTLAVPGVTRAWCSPLEMGPGTVTIRFMMDDLRSLNNGLPTTADIATVKAYLDTVRPVSTKDIFVLAPTLYPISFTITNLVSDSASTRAAIANAVTAMLKDRATPAYSSNGVAQPAQTIYAAWISDAILGASGVESFTLTMTDQVMPNSGCMAVLGTITYA
ncbi:baseplate J/gp47 family protein [Rhizobium miluonense]|uniref:Uncharacterized phage protein gp47/JayE n=1 Tax=Rhizobium miluonense TaxID=411945 RepID=A0A1C3WP38_9HYPH|nr:baseplate J/gp47 family protein [Rhizobium miluonense]SCB41741.1 Uncharacterized phage protein gp47/JayE [Rhizobium miluonense]